MPTMQADAKTEAGPGAQRAIVVALLRLASLPKDNWEDSIQQILQISRRSSGSTVSATGASASSRA